MEEQTNVKTIGELKKSVEYNAENTVGILEAYETSRSTDATEEEKFNEGRHGRALLASIDATHQALNALRMRVSLQVEGRESARAKQLDRILGIAEDVEDVDYMIDVAKRAVEAKQHDERDFARDLDDTLTIIQPGDEGGGTT